MERAASSGAGSFIGNAGGFVVLKTFSITDIGKRRKLNQDYVFVSDKPLGNLPNLFIVADGMGGHNAGDYASKGRDRPVPGKESGENIGKGDRSR